MTYAPQNGLASTLEPDSQNEACDQCLRYFPLIYKKNNKKKKQRSIVGSVQY